MPYKIKGNAVYREDTGKLVGHSDNPKKYLRALYAAENKGLGSKNIKRKK